MWCIQTIIPSATCPQPSWVLPSTVGPHSWLPLTFPSNTGPVEATRMQMHFPGSIHQAFTHQSTPGTSVPELLQQVVVENRVTQATVSAFPCYSPPDLHVLQEADPVIREFLTFWNRKRAPDAAERRQASKEVLVVTKQWDQLVEQGGVLYRRVSPSVEEMKCSSWYSLHRSRHRYFSSCTMNMGTKVLSEQQSWSVCGAIGQGCTTTSSNGVGNVNAARYPNTLNLLPVHIWITCLLLVQTRSWPSISPSWSVRRMDQRTSWS